MNTWPDGKRRALDQSEHENWNANHYPGTKQMCCKCDEPTKRCEEDGMFDDNGEAYCRDCAIKFEIFEY